MQILPASSLSNFRTVVCRRKTGKTAFESSQQVQPFEHNFLRSVKGNSSPLTWDFKLR